MRKWIPDLGGVSEFLGKCILYSYPIFLTFIHSQHQDWPQCSCSFRYLLVCLYLCQRGRRSWEKDYRSWIEYREELTYASTQPLLCYSEKQQSWLTKEKIFPLGDDAQKKWRALFSSNNGNLENSPFGTWKLMVYTNS